MRIDKAKKTEKGEKRTEKSGSFRGALGEWRRKRRGESSKYFFQLSADWEKQTLTCSEVVAGGTEKWGESKGPGVVWVVGGLGPARSGAGGWSRRGEEGWSDREQGDGEAKGGRINAACLSLPFSLSLYLFSPSNIHTHTQTHTRSEADSKSPSHSDNRQRKSLYIYKLCHRGRMGWAPLPLSSRQPMAGGREVSSQPMKAEADGALPQPISAVAHIQLE